MLNIHRKKQPIIVAVAMLLVSVFAFSCNGNDKKKTEPEVEVAPAAVEPTVTDQNSNTDSLPPIDTGASARPDGIKTQPPQPGQRK